MMTNDELFALVNRSLFAVLGYTDTEGRPNVRKVFCVWHKGLGRHLISTNTSSSHVQSLLQNGSACMYFSDDRTFEGLCLYGHAEVHFDRTYKALLWNDGDEKYYPKGIEDEDYCVIEFAADAGRFYRFDGKGDLTGSGIAEYDAGRTFENGYTQNA